MNEELFRPGEECHCSGIYKIVDINGKRVNPSVERTIIKGSPFPPSDSHDHRYSLARAAIHSSFLKPEELFKPGTPCPASGVYRMVGADGEFLQPINERTIVKGDNFPPSDASGHRYVLIRATAHKN